MNYNLLKINRTYYVVVIVILSSSIIFIFPQANAQQSTRQMIQQLESEGKQNCEVWQINDFFYKPVRISITHETADPAQVKITSDDPASKVFWDGDRESFQLTTDSTDRHRVELIFNYAVKHDNPRQVYYQVFAQDRTLMMEGNWVHTGNSFCKVIEFWTQDPPHILTPVEIQEENNKFNSDFRKEVAEQSTTVQNGILILAIVIVITAILNTVYFISVILTQRNLGKVADRPAKKLNEMIEKLRKTNEAMELTTKNVLEKDDQFREQAIRKIDNSLKDLSIVVSNTQQRLEMLASTQDQKPSPQIHDSTITPVKVDTSIDEQQEERNEEAYKIEYGLGGLKSQENQLQHKIHATAITDNEKLAEQPQKEKVHEINFEEIKCSICKRQSEFFCDDCERMFCTRHQTHRCNDNRQKLLTKQNLLKVIKTRIIKSVIENKGTIFTDDELMMYHLDHGKTKNQIKEELVAGYRKIPFYDAKKIYDDMNKNYEKNKTFPKSIRLEAMLERLVKGAK